MNFKDTGGPAFPTTRPVSEPGMSLRDWFAGMALSGWMARPDFTIDIDREMPGMQRAALCYCLADAMIAERKKQS